MPRREIMELKVKAQSLPATYGTILTEMLDLITTLELSVGNLVSRVEKLEGKQSLHQVRGKVKQNTDNGVNKNILLGTFPMIKNK